MNAPARANQRPEREPGNTLIVVVRPGATAADVRDLARAVDVEIIPLHRPAPKRAKSRSSRPRRTKRTTPDLSLFYRVRAPQERLADLAERLRHSDIVAGAYLKGRAELPAASADCTPRTQEPGPVTPNFQPNQAYLRKAPGGIDAKFAWTKNGGTGIGVQIIDVERAWRFTHEDLLSNPGGVVAGYPPSVQRMENHGTAVVGILRGERNSRGVSGICPDADLRAISTFDADGEEDTASAILQAIPFLAPGDIMLLEMHRLGPPAYEAGDRYIPVEWWLDDFAAIQTATNEGVIVIEAAGNGSSDLDDSLYDTPKPGFPAEWTNPFDRSVADSGAILVGAGAPPLGSWGKDRSRLNFSNHGSMVDAQGWGREVVTLGYGCLQGGSDKNRWYMGEFGGTSGASPMVVGAIASIQGRLAALGKPLLTPATARALVRSTGSPQQDEIGFPATQRIGNRPDLKEMFDSLGLSGSRGRGRRR
jgi:hypothetical protein